MTKFYIITPCFNAEKYIEETIHSVLSQTVLQNINAELEYWIIDGGSSDKTVEIARRFKSPYIHILSEKDRGLYDALVKGIRKITTPGICGYLNAGDLYSRQAFEIVLELFETKNIKWLTGINAVFNYKSQLVNFYIPYQYRPRLFSCGAYGDFLPYVQQEVTFWHSSLNTFLDLEKLSRFQLAGDYYLWHTFSKHEPLNIACAYLGGFKIHQNQLSVEKKQIYENEKRAIVHKPFLIHKLFLLNAALMLWDRLLWYAPPKVKKAFNPKTFFLYDHAKQAWY